MGDTAAQCPKCHCTNVNAILMEGKNPVAQCSKCHWTWTLNQEADICPMCGGQPTYPLSSTIHWIADGLRLRIRLKRKCPRCGARFKPNI